MLAEIFPSFVWQQWLNVSLTLGLVVWFQTSFWPNLLLLSAPLFSMSFFEGVLSMTVANFSHSYFGRRLFTILSVPLVFMGFWLFRVLAYQHCIIHGIAFPQWTLISVSEVAAASAITLSMGVFLLAVCNWRIGLRRIGYRRL